MIYGKLTVHPRQTDRDRQTQTKFTLRSLKRGLLTLASIKASSVHAHTGYFACALESGVQIYDVDPLAEKGRMQEPMGSW